MHPNGTRALNRAAFELAASLSGRAVPAAGSYPTPPHGPSLRGGAIVNGRRRRSALESMTAYVILEIDWHDPVRGAEYRKLLGPTLDRFGGKTLVANEARALEGDWNPRRVVVFEFPSLSAVEEWYRSPEYAPVMRIRKDGASSRMIVVERPPPP
jgi:uncharacterized protein (DUF1330 family)